MFIFGLVWRQPNVCSTIELALAGLWPAATCGSELAMSLTLAKVPSDIYSQRRFKSACATRSLIKVFVAWIKMYRWRYLGNATITGAKRRRDEGQIRTTQRKHMKPQTSKQRSISREVGKLLTGLKPVLFARNSSIPPPPPRPLNFVAALNYKKKKNNKQTKKTVDSR